MRLKQVKRAFSNLHFLVFCGIQLQGRITHTALDHKTSTIGLMMSPEEHSMNISLNSKTLKDAQNYSSWGVTAQLTVRKVWLLNDEVCQYHLLNDL